MDILSNVATCNIISNMNNLYISIALVHHINITTLFHLKTHGFMEKARRGVLMNFLQVLYFNFALSCTMYSVVNIIRAKIGALIFAFGHNFSFSRVIYWLALSLKLVI